MKCTYCQSENNDVKNVKICSKCGAELSSTRFVVRDEIDIADVVSDFQTKQQYHTFDLLKMLQIARKERSDAYYLMTVVLRANEKHDVEVDDELLTNAREQYDLFTIHKNVIEQILIDRIGYYPKRIDDTFLAKYYAKLKLV